MLGGGTRTHSLLSNFHLFETRYVKNFAFIVSFLVDLMFLCVYQSYIAQGMVLV